MIRFHKFSLIIVVIALLIILLSGSIMSHVKEPDFKVLKEEQNIQIREYVPIIAAEVIMNGERDKAINSGFKVLADFIFGNNTTKKEIAMTAPVMQQQNEKIAMTAPVIQQQTNPNEWKVQFVMPADYTVENLPTPNDPRIKIISIPNRKFVVISFSGLSTKKNLESHLKQLQDYVAVHRLQITGEPVFAFYNPPWTLPFLRRNEIMYQLIK